MGAPHFVWIGSAPQEIKNHCANNRSWITMNSDHGRS